MTPELWQRLKPLFHAALDRGAEEREVFISEACGNDAELKENLARLIQAAQDETKTLDGPLVRLFSSKGPRFRPGEVILERFRIVRPIGSGGMGEVYEAEDLQLGRIAIKTIRDGIASSSGAFDRFRQEVQLARKVSGSQVCRIHELYLFPASGSHAATAFLTMEYLDGITLSEKLKNDGPLPLKEALRVALDICEGLSLIHGKGVIHRDLKSANIMLCGQRDSLRAVLTDFGLARDFNSDAISPQTRENLSVQVGTLPGAILGTPAYMAPEQFEGKPVSPATDIYALGIVLYELVTALHPYAAPTPVAAAIRRAHHPAPASSLNHAIPRKWDRVIQRCLQYEPADRFQSADEVAKALRASPANPSNLRQDRPWLFRFACALTLVVFAWGIFIWWQTKQYYHPGLKPLRSYNDGLSLIREGNYAEATRLLQDALSKEPHFVMAHARLAEAWYNLDFQGNAQQQLLIALPGRSRLSPLDQKYLDAIQATVTGDFSNALSDYRRILGDLPPTDRSSGYVDLGMAYERAGDVNGALGMYSKAVTENSNNPAAFMHTGVLQSRLHHFKEGDQAFDRAQAIFEAEIDSHGKAGNSEGLAELDYERGYAANDRGDSKDAEPYLEQSLIEAKKIPSIQLEIRTDIQLSSVESEAYQDSLAVENAEEAIKLAQDNPVASWAANGKVRLANAQLIQGHLKEAEKPLQEAIQILDQSPQPRVMALANSTLASLMDQEHYPDKVAEPAKAALDYYKKDGFSEGASSAGVLLVRAERDKGQYKQALEDGSALLALDDKQGIPAFTMHAEELVGSVYLALERYPDALTHFQKARDLASTDKQRSYQALHCAAVLWRLGRYPESAVMLRLASVNPLLLTGVGQQSVESLLSRQKYKSSLDLAHQVIDKNPDMPADSKQKLEKDEAIAQSHLDMNKQALAGLGTSIAPNPPNANPADSAQDKLIAAEIYLRMGMTHQAHDAALAALGYFASAEQWDSELRSACLAAAAAQALKDEASYQSSAKKIVDILTELRHTWGPESFQTYLARPDIRALTQHIPGISKSN
jgi:serine/threonine protein kinase/predicted negative regulator of RcsB-dependent stress response